MEYRATRFLPIAFLGFILAAAAAFGSPVIKLKVTAEIANVRVKPFIGSNIVRQFPEGTVLEAERKEGEWFLVKMEPDETGTISGYVHESLVLALGDVPITEPVPAPVVEIPQVIPLPEPKAAQPEPIETPPSVYEATREIMAAAAAESPVSLFLWGGGGITAVGDLNDGIQGLADFYADQIHRPAGGETAPLRTGLQYGGEIGFKLLPRLRLSVGAEFLRASKENVLAFAGDSEIPSDLTVKPSFSAIPVHLALAYYPLDFLYLKAGAGYFFTRTEYRYVFTHGDILRDWEGEATASGAGFLAGIGLDFSLGRYFCLTAEVGGRYAKISGFSGTNAYRDEISTEPYLETGTLYAFDVRTTSRTAYPLVFIRNGKPFESGVENAREARLDLTGLSVRIGLKYRF
ncbi:MAG TPA: autotransporter outer membrane beta-barrel domain-containing protein [Candidatus Aminicenantes bacterium]|nr:autotransporter outer membrane beta-barrel domain-containing protein [Candidatus Aminicenantes bacterium]HOS10289.1 autotransporter outer membrane beta-barrel domain-containing protein [Candidatus Aminicenantes bacterium]HPL14974.1 autotransporter outer membrane beta-barrel domain-containing protein [Candidatus Aminicenantes bacterium]HQH45535.1 autotransporter outer membrane beta-barrel domain-containing protein [Candidatus Aminicenantes bacterium]HQJ42816.1 autotransporter outer membrane b